MKYKYNWVDLSSNKTTLFFLFGLRNSICISKRKKKYIYSIDLNASGLSEAGSLLQEEATILSKTLQCYVVKLSSLEGGKVFKIYGGI